MTLFHAKNPVAGILDAARGIPDNNATGELHGLGFLNEEDSRVCA